MRKKEWQIKVALSQLSKDCESLRKKHFHLSPKGHQKRWVFLGEQSTNRPPQRRPSPPLTLTHYRDMPRKSPGNDLSIWALGMLLLEKVSLQSESFGNGVWTVRLQPDSWFLLPHVANLEFIRIQDYFLSVWLTCHFWRNYSPFLSSSLSCQVHTFLASLTHSNCSDSQQEVPVDVYYLVQKPLSKWRRQFCQTDISEEISYQQIVTHKTRFCWDMHMPKELR